MKINLRKWFARSFMTLCAGAALSAPCNAELITNGSLEAGLVGFHNYGVPSELGTHRYGPPTFGSTLPTGWGRTGTRSWTVSDLAGTAFPAANGNYAFRLDSRVDVGGLNKLTQGGLALDAGSIYELSVDMWSEQTGQGAVLNVDFTGPATINAIVGKVDATVGIEKVTASFTPTVTGVYTIELFNESGTGNNHTWVDNISLVRVTPEPSSALLVGMGLVGLLGIRRRRRR